VIQNGGGGVSWSRLSQHYFAIPNLITPELDTFIFSYMQSQFFYVVPVGVYCWVQRGGLGLIHFKCKPKSTTWTGECMVVR
jgi:hypothetical protein